MNAFQRAYLAISILVPIRLSIGINSKNLVKIVDWVLPKRLTLMLQTACPLQKDRGCAFEIWSAEWRDSFRLVQLGCCYLSPLRRNETAFDHRSRACSKLAPALLIVAWYTHSSMLALQKSINYYWLIHLIIN